MQQNPRKERALQILDAVNKRLDEARSRENYDDIRVDLLAIIQYIQRELGRIETELPPEPPPD